MDDAGRRRTRVLTVPNVLSLARLVCVPVFVWLYVGRERPVAAGVLLAALGATDWVDGYVARRFDQGSELGKVLDPTADRVLLVAAVLALLAEGDVPVWVGAVVLAREVLISVAVVVLALAGARRVDVRWSGKAGTLSLMFALPSFVLAEALATGGGVARVVAWCFTAAGLVLSYWAALRYVPEGRRALADGRSARRAPAVVAAPSAGTGGAA